MTRKLAVLASLAVGALYAAWRIWPTYHPEIIAAPATPSCPALPSTLAPGATFPPCFPWPAGTTWPASWEWPARAATWPTVVLEGAIVAILVFLVIAALRWAWGSFR
jgi:hypothetical protein